MGERFEFTRNQISLILGVKNIRVIESRGNLRDRLLQKGIRLIDRYKSGRSFVYIIENIDNISFEELCKKYKIKKIKEFGIHTSNRYYSIKGENNLKSKRQFAEAIDSDVYNINKFDHVLLEEKFMVNDGFIYLHYKNGKFIGEVPREHYNRFWFNNSIEKKELNNLYRRLKAGEITKEEHLCLTNTIIEKLNRSGEIIHKVRAFTRGSAFEELFNKINNL